MHQRDKFPETSHFERRRLTHLNRYVIDSVVQCGHFLVQPRYLKRQRGILLAQIRIFRKLHLKTCLVAMVIFLFSSSRELALDRFQVSTTHVSVVRTKIELTVATFHCFQLPRAVDKPIHLGTIIKFGAKITRA